MRQFRLFLEADFQTPENTALNGDFQPSMEILLPSRSIFKRRPKECPSSQITSDPRQLLGANFQHRKIHTCQGALTSNNTGILYGRHD